MSPLNYNPDMTDAEEETVMQPSGRSDMRRVSLSLAFSPKRRRRRRYMNTINGWLRTRLGISVRRLSRTH